MKTDFVPCMIDNFVPLHLIKHKVFAPIITNYDNIMQILQVIDDFRHFNKVQVHILLITCSVHADVII